MSNKTKMQIDHAIKRAEERYGSKFSKNDIYEICKKIRNNKTISVGKDGRITNTRSFHVVEYLGKKYSVIYDRERQTLSTFLPEEVDALEKILQYQHDKRENL